MTHYDETTVSMDLQRRAALQAAGLAAVMASFSGVMSGATAAEQARSGGMNMDMGKGLKVAMLVHPQMVALDLIGPQTFFKLMRADVHLVWKEKTAVMTEIGLPIMPTHTFDECPKDVDVLFVPGGLEGSIAVMDDPTVIGFLADRGARARYVTSVCTGSLVLGAAGLLNGYNATGHWYIRDMLSLMGATPVKARVVRDRNRITGGGVTAGIDFGLEISRELHGEEHTKHFALVLEYDPDPPIKAGTPEQAGPDITGFILKGRGPVIEKARVKAEAAGKTLKKI